MTNPLPNVAISEQGLRELEIRLSKELIWTPWVYFGSPGEPNVTPRSPEFLNGWHNTGDGKQRLRFRRTVPHKGQLINSLEIEGQIAVGADGTLVGTLPATFIPKETAILSGATEGLDVSVFRLDTNGDLTFLGTVNGGGGGGGGAGIRYVVVNTGEWLDVETTGELPTTYEVVYPTVGTVGYGNVGQIFRARAGKDLLFMAIDDDLLGGGGTVFHLIGDDFGGTFTVNAKANNTDGFGGTFEAILTGDSGGTATFNLTGTSSDGTFTVQGANAEFDLDTAGDTFTVKDSTGTPLVTYTG